MFGTYSNSDFEASRGITCSANVRKEHNKLDANECYLKRLHCPVHSLSCFEAVRD